MTEKDSNPGRWTKFFAPRKSTRFPFFRANIAFSAQIESAPCGSTGGIPSKCPEIFVLRTYLNFCRKRRDFVANSLKACFLYPLGK